MPILRRLSLLFFAATLTLLGCHAQVPATLAVGKPLPPATAHKLEVLLREKAQLPPASTINIGTPETSDLPGFINVPITFTSPEGKTSNPVHFLVSFDGKTVAQFTKYDISNDTRALVSGDGRPSRGGPVNAPVVIVGFDDLECPFCARLNETIFPALTKRYGDKVRIVYKDFPIEQHPWAMRAAVDVNCLAAQSGPGYWNAVDYIHAHAPEIGKDAAGGPTPPAPAPDQDGKTPAAPPDKTLDRANAQLDQIARDQGKVEKVDETKLNACIAKQDKSAIEASMQIADNLQVGSTPTLFINGLKIEGAVPLDFLFNIVDNSLRAVNVTPPPPYVAPGQPVPSALPAATPKPGK